MQGYRRHVGFYRLMRWVLHPLMRWYFRLDAAPAPQVNGPYLVIANHTTDFDSIFLSMSFPKHMYFVASEHIFRLPLLRGLFHLLLNPIPKRKGGADVGTAMQMMRRLKKGANIALFAEGNKAFHGETGPIHPATATLVKNAGVTLITYRLTGGYFTSPRWAHTLRRGQVSGRPVNVYPPQTLAVMTQTQIAEAIARDIHEDAYARQAENPVRFKGKCLAEGIQNALYLCPKCLGFDTLRGQGDTLACGCGFTATYLDTGFLAGPALPFHTLAAWGRWQHERLKEMLALQPDRPAFEHAQQTVVRVLQNHSTVPVAQGTLSLSRQGLVCGAFTLPLNQLFVLEIYGKNTVVFSDGQGNRYQVRSQTERSGLPYFETYELLRESRG